MNKDELGTRMKSYENISRNYLTKKLPVIIRIDGKAFHTFTRGMQKPFDGILIDTMYDTAKELCSKIQGCKIAYVQSDEISLLLTDYESIKTDPWFGYNIQKMTSISASIATLAFNLNFITRVNLNSMLSPEQFKFYQNKYYSALFDSRVFTIPFDEVCNYFIWRQNDCSKNSIQMVGCANFSQKELHKLNCSQIQEKLFQEKDINWNDLSIPYKRGVCIIKENYNKDGVIRTRWVEDLNIPIFTQDREYINQYVYVK